MEKGKAVVHIINKFKVRKENPSFRCILIYQDLETGYCIIRPLLFKIDLEITMELFKIFTSYGPPSELCINSCTQDMIDVIHGNMKSLYPLFDVKFTKKTLDSTGTAMKVITKLHEWMEETKKDEWEIGCFIIQKKINMEYSTELKSTPQDLFFKKGKEIKTDISENVNNSSYVSHETGRPIKQEQSVQQEQKSIVNSAPEESLFNLGSVRVKQETEHYEDTVSMKERLVLFEGGLIFSGSKEPNTHVEVKLERLDE